MQVRYTKHPVIRGTRADAESADEILLIKNVSLLRATYQIRLLAFKAVQTRKTLVITVPKRCEIHPSLRDLMSQVPEKIRLRRRGD